MNKIRSHNRFKFLLHWILNLLRIGATILGTYYICSEHLFNNDKEIFFKPPLVLKTLYFPWILLILFSIIYYNFIELFSIKTPNMKIIEYIANKFSLFSKLIPISMIIFGIIFTIHSFIYEFQGSIAQGLSCTILSAIYAIMGLYFYKFKSINDE